MNLSARQRDEYIEYIKQEMLSFDVDDYVKSPTSRKESQLLTNSFNKYMNNFNLNTDVDDRDTPLHSSSHTLEIELYIERESDKSTKTRIDSISIRYIYIC